MLNKIKEIFSPKAGNVKDAPVRDRLHLAAAALLVEAAATDAQYGAPQREVVERLCREQFALDADEAAELVRDAEAEIEGTNELYGFTRIVREAMPPEERVAIIEMLWEVVYADGTLHEYEASLLRRICGLIYVTDQDSGAARKRVLEKMGL
ncbi:TerB family tellurite resistance protein [Oceanibaculum nanhaiense]|uniref:tellurite resistance TerB family protein n=1 Tax=Oceanibaculum nanhaiense TaxID=1909734 RepID=UPI003D2971A9